MPEVVPLDILAENECGRIVEVVGPDGPRHRLHELGLQPGACVRMVKPGEPCLLAIGEHRISLRLTPELMVFVQVEHQPVPRPAETP